MRRASTLLIGLMAVAATQFALQRAPVYMPCCGQAGEAYTSCKPSQVARAEMKSPEVKPCCLPLQRDDKTQPAIVVPLANQLGGDVAILAPAQPILVLSSADPDFARYHSTSPPRHLDLLLLHSRLNI